MLCDRVGGIQFHEKIHLVIVEALALKGLDVMKLHRHDVEILPIFLLVLLLLRLRASKFISTFVTSLECNSWNGEAVNTPPFLCRSAAGVRHFAAVLHPSLSTKTDKNVIVLVKIK